MSFPSHVFPTLDRSIIFYGKCHEANTGSQKDCVKESRYPEPKNAL